MSSEKLTHIDDMGQISMVDVIDKEDTDRTAIARGEIVLRRETLDLIRQGLMKKGDVLTVAKIAGIMGAKHTPDLIPLCHPLPNLHAAVDLEIKDELPGIEITAHIRSIGKTGAEMEALTAVAVAALTVYDMVKAVEKTGRIQNIRLLEKHGGKSGDLINQ
ncbi:MAG: cyclic pyranopterin monophosphate synthase MoaC [Anaerolineaceae bacterium]